MTGKIPLRFADVKVGDAIHELVKKISMVQNVMYAAATWDFHRIHYDADIVRSKGFQKPFADGQIFGAFLAQMLTDWVGFEGALKRLKLNYRTMAFVGDTVTCKGKVSEKRTEAGENLVLCELWIENQKGERIVADAAATIAFPTK